jgi:hypothetical protein|eukprot:COSAG01_NODE_546_length_15649_cov_21.047395_7_plen_316_part_00
MAGLRPRNECPPAFIRHWRPNQRRQRDGVSGPVVRRCCCLPCRAASLYTDFRADRRRRVGSSDCQAASTCVLDNDRAFLCRLPTHSKGSQCGGGAGRDEAKQCSNGLAKQTHRTRDAFGDTTPSAHVTDTRRCPTDTVAMGVAVILGRGSGGSLNVNPTVALWLFALRVSAAHGVRGSGAGGGSGATTASSADTRGCCAAEVGPPSPQARAPKGTGRGTAVVQPPRIRSAASSRGLFLGEDAAHGDSCNVGAAATAPAPSEHAALRTNSVCHVIIFAREYIDQRTFMRTNLPPCGRQGGRPPPERVEGRRQGGYS